MCMVCAAHVVGNMWRVAHPELRVCAHVAHTGIAHSETTSTITPYIATDSKEMQLNTGLTMTSHCYKTLHVVVVYTYNV